MSWIGRCCALDSQESSMASVNPSMQEGTLERSASRPRTGVGLVVFAWLLVMIPLFWGVLMTLKEVRKFTG
jgi:hypothetical protein